MEIQSGSIRCVFGKSGMPEKILLPEEFGGRNLLRDGGAELRITLADGRILHPVVIGESETGLRESPETGAKIVQFLKLGLAEDGSGRLQPGWYVKLQHEVYEDGTVFSDGFFMSDRCRPEAIAGFEIRYPLSLAAFPAVRWSLMPCPRKIDGALIQTAGPERELNPGENRLLDRGIFPMTGFYFESGGGPSGYAEFFMEGDNVAGPDPNANASSITWENGDPTLVWNFQTQAATPVIGPWQWRNQWGFVVAAAPKQRHLPPMAMYQYMDNREHFPSDACIDAMAETGIDVLILHDCWRLDPQDDGVAYDPARFRQVVDRAHRHGIRIAVYMRGNENSVAEHAAEWFGQILTPDFDGLYMDYGGPFHWKEPPTEIYQNGRLHFRKHYRQNRLLRKVVGADGLLFSHTGPMFSALGMTGGIVNGYISGEGERGVMIRSRFDHACYSMAAVCPGTMWTAAFPEYGQAVMRPFLAAAGQSPHVPLGYEMPSSSLAHPPVPGFSDVNFRPLWKLWRLMRNERDLRIRCDFNCSGVFPHDENVSHYLMAAKDRAVCIYANFSDAAVRVDPAIDWRNAGLDVPCGKISLCRPDVRTPGRPVPFDGLPFELGPKDVAALCFGEFDFAGYARPYPGTTELARAYLDEIAEQKKLRAGIGESSQWFLRLRVPELSLAYEASMVYDLYDNRLEFGEISGGSFVRYGYLGKHGFQQRMTEPADFIGNGGESDWIPIGDVVGTGVKHLAIRSMHRGDLYYVNQPFYSFIEVEVAREPGRPDAVVRFLNEVESDRSFLHFTLTVLPRPGNMPPA